MNGSISGQQETMHNSRPIDALSPTIHTPRICLILTQRVSFAGDSEIPLKPSKLNCSPCREFLYDGPIIRSDTSALLLQHDHSSLVQERGRDAGGHAVNVGAGCWHWLWLLESTQPRDLKQLLVSAPISAWTLPSATTCVLWLTSPCTTSSSIASL